MPTGAITIVLVGPLPPPMGGNTRHFATLVEDLTRSDGFKVVLVDTSRGQEHSRPLRNALVALRTLLGVARKLPRADLVSYHASNRGMLRFAPVVVALSRLMRKPVVLRVFGGSFGDLYLERSAIKRALIRRLILSADVTLLQTRRSIDQLAPHAAGRLEWFSTYVRSQRPAEGRERPDCTKFVFLGHLWRKKGLETILEAAPHLPGESSIDIYGPLDEYTAAEIGERGRGRVRYRGFLTHEEVDRKLWEYDCLVLPTFHDSEGYPGVIAEAFTHGLPVISTRWLAIPEIVDDECGILCEPGDTRAFIAAVTALYTDRALYSKLCKGAVRQGRQFDHVLWSKKFETICGSLLGRAAPAEDAQVSARVDAEAGDS